MMDYTEANAAFSRRLQTKFDETIATMKRQGITITEVDRMELAADLADTLAETMSGEDEEHSYDPFKGNTHALSLHNQTVEEPEETMNDKITRGWKNVVNKLRQGRTFAEVKAMIEKFATKFEDGTEDKQACRILWARVNKAERLYRAPAEDYSAVFSVMTDTWGSDPTALAHRMECRRREERIAAAFLVAV